MKKALLALLAVTATFAASAISGTFKSGDCVYAYNLEEATDDVGSSFYEAELTGVTFVGSGTSPYATATEIDLAGISKVFDELADGQNAQSGQNALPIRFVSVSVETCQTIWSDAALITSVNFPGSFGDPVSVFENLQTVYPNLRALSISGEGAYATYDGVVYTADLKELVYCPPAKTSVEIPAACTTLPAGAFASCHQLASVTGGAGLLYVGENAFGETGDEACERGESAVAMPALPFVRSFKPGEFMTVGKVVFGYRGEIANGTLTFPAGVRAIADGAFSTKADLKYAQTVFLMNDADFNAKTKTWACTLRWVGRDAFSGTAFETVTGSLAGVIWNYRHGSEARVDDPDPAHHGQTLLALADEAYRGNVSITNVTIPASVEEIGSACFADCANLECVTFLGTPKRLRDSVFENCPKLRTVRFEQARVPPADTDGDFYAGAEDDLVTYVPGCAANWPTNAVGEWADRALSRSIRVIAREGVYGKWTLAELGVTLPKAGTVFTPKAYGLPRGLVLKSNAAVTRNKKIVTRAKTSWWIEGVPLEARDFETNPATIVVNLYGRDVWQTLQLEVRALEPTPVDLDPALQVNVAATDFTLPGVGKGWTVSELPTGLKFATSAVMQKVKTRVKGKTKVVSKVAHAAYSVYGTPTQAGVFTVSATKKLSTGFSALRKFAISVRDADGNVPSEGPAILSGFNGGSVALVATVGVTNQFETIEVSGGTTLTASGLPKGVTLRLDGDRYVFDGVPSAAGTYVVTITAMKNGRKVVQRRSIRFEALPDALVGSYAGRICFDPEDSSDCAQITMTIASTGKVSGKFTRKGKTFTFSRTGLEDTRIGPGRDVLIMRELVAGHVPTDSKGRPVPSKAETVRIGDVKVDAASVDALILVGGGSGGEAWFEAQKNLWSRDYSAIGKALYKLSSENVIADPENAKQTLKLKLFANGVLSAALTVPTGIAKYPVHRAVCSAVVRAQSFVSEGAGGFRGYVDLVFPAATKKVGARTYKFPGAYRRLAVPILVSGQDVWSTGEFRTMAETLMQSCNGQSLLYTGVLSVKVSGMGSSSGNRFVATFKPAGCNPVEFSGTFTRRETSWGGVYYRAVQQVTFGEGVTRLLFLEVSKTNESVPSIERGKLMAGFVDDGAGSYFIPLNDNDADPKDPALQSYWSRTDAGLEFSRPVPQNDDVSVLFSNCGVTRTISYGDLTLEDGGVVLLYCRGKTDADRRDIRSSIDNVTFTQSGDGYTGTGYVYFEHDGVFHRIQVTFGSNALGVCSELTSARFIE